MLGWALLAKSIRSFGWEPVDQLSAGLLFLTSEGKPANGVLRLPDEQVPTQRLFLGPSFRGDGSHIAHGTHPLPTRCE